MSGCIHELSYYLLTNDKGGYLGNVSQLPTVMVQGDSEDDIHSKILQSVRSYLRTFPTEHQRLLKDISSKIEKSTIKSGKVLGVKPLTVDCN